jgi:hypothetical protein
VTYRLPYVNIRQEKESTREPEIRERNKTVTTLKNIITCLHMARTVLIVTVRHYKTDTVINLLS